jgi:hypothetical protein
MSNRVPVQRIRTEQTGPVKRARRSTIKTLRAVYGNPWVPVVTLLILIAGGLGANALGNERTSDMLIGGAIATLGFSSLAARGLRGGD